VLLSSGILKLNDHRWESILYSKWYYLTGALGGGLLGGALRKAQEGRRASPRMQETIEKNRAKLEAYEGFCDSLGEQPAQVALAWLLANPVVTAPIIGPRTTQQLDETLRALDIPMPPETLKKLDEIFPGPGGPAPEAYAW
jgi:aryl-alcohol dehydrogenase-like predicted oxidoreductase